MQLRKYFSFHVTLYYEVTDAHINEYPELQHMCSYPGSSSGSTTLTSLPPHIFRLSLI